MTILSIDPDQGTTLATATGILANRTAPRKAELPVGDGVVPDDSCSFRTVDVPSFTVKPRDRVVESDGTSWVVESVEFVAWGGGLKMLCTKHRG